MSSNYPNAYPTPPGHPNPPTASTQDPYAAYYAQMMADPAYAAYYAQYYAAYGATPAADSASMYGAAASASAAAAPPVSLDLDQVILKSEITRKPSTTAAQKKSLASASAAAPTAPVSTNTTTQSSTDAASASASAATGQASSASDTSTLKKKKRKADSEKAKEDKANDPNLEDDQQPQAKKKRMIRYAAGQVWEDKSLIEWPDNDYRLFVGDLGPEVMTQTLEQAFGKFASFQKAHVVRDQRTGKSKGYGFVSFMNGDDFVKAFQEYNNKYIGSRPVKLRKSTWQERNIEKKKEKLAKIFK